MRCLKYLISALLLAAGLNAVAVQAASQPVRPYRITMLLNRGCEEACKGFQQHFRQQGIAVDFTLRDAAQDRRRIADFLQEIRQTPPASRPDLVLTWGTLVTQTAVGNWKGGQRAVPEDIPVVFMVVSDPVDAGILEQLDRPRRGVTGSLYLLPLETQLQAARSYLDFHRVGYLLNRTETNSVSTLTHLKEQARVQQFALEVAELPLTPAGKPDATALPGIIEGFRKSGVDLIYQGPDTFLNIRRDQLTDSALAQGIPVFAAAEAPVQQSRALFGVVNRYWDVGNYTASQAVRILRDRTPPEQIPVTLPRNFSYLINLPVALQLKLYPPLKLLDMAEITGIASQEQP